MGTRGKPTFRGERRHPKFRGSASLSDPNRRNHNSCIAMLVRKIGEFRLWRNRKRVLAAHRREDAGGVIFRRCNRMPDNRMDHRAYRPLPFPPLKKRQPSGRSARQTFIASWAASEASCHCIAENQRPESISLSTTCLFRVLKTQMKAVDSELRGVDDVSRHIHQFK